MYRSLLARLGASIVRRRSAVDLDGRPEPMRLHDKREDRFIEAISRLYSQGIGRGF